MKIKRSVIAVLSLCLSLILASYTDGFIRPGVLKFFNGIKGKGFKLTPQVEVRENGIPITIYPDLGPQINPVNIAQQALTYWDKGQYNLFLKIANWFCENTFEHDSFAVWQYQFPWKSYNMTPPWVSGMAQGLAVDVLGRAYHLTGNEIYLNTAKKALKAFLVPIEEGGVRTEDWWYEEYADVGGKNPRVLNGMIYALQGIYNFWIITGDSLAKMIFDNGLSSLKKNLSMYDARGWSYYDALHNIASEHYHRIHIKQMDWLYEITGDTLFAHYAVDWKGDLHSPLRFILVVLMKGPQESDIAVLIINFIGIYLLIVIINSIIKASREKNKGKESSHEFFQGKLL